MIQQLSLSEHDHAPELTPRRPRVAARPAAAKGASAPGTLVLVTGVALAASLSLFGPLLGCAGSAPESEPADAAVAEARSNMELAPPDDGPVPRADLAKGAPSAPPVSTEYSPFCPVGVWIRAPEACSCPPYGREGYTWECESSDCQQTDVLAMTLFGEAMRATVRFTAEEQQLSAAGGDVLEGTWKYLDDGELMLEFGDTVISTATECKPDELQPKGQPTLVRPPPELELALVWAWITSDFSDAPYFP